MAAALQVADQLIVGQELVIAGTGWVIDHAYTAVLTLPGPAQPSITLKGVTSHTGVIDSTAVATIIPGNEGVVLLTVSDGTSTLKDSAEVFRSV